ncbi:MAG: Abi-alpha family protein [Sphingorhabdus sp.]
MADSDKMLPSVAGALVDAVAGTTKPLRNAIGATIADIWQGFFGNRALAWQIENAADVKMKLEKKLLAKGVAVDFAKVPNHYAFTWIDEATKQETPEIQELFATLLANAATGNEDALQRRNVEIVSKMTPMDALLLSHLIEIFTIRFQVHDFRRQELRIANRTLCSLLSEDFNFEDFICMENLTNLGVLSQSVVSSIDKQAIEKIANNATSTLRGAVKLGGSGPNISRAIQQDEVLSITLTGRSLIFALFPELVNGSE